MPKEWILNLATNRWGLNKKKSVGPVSQWIRECEPSTLREWERCYIKKLQEFLGNKDISLSPENYLEELGKKLYVKISEVIRAEIDEITEEDCINYIKQLVFNRTYEGYLTEIKTIYELLEKLLKVKIKPAPDDWDRLYNVDFYIEVNGKFIGLQIKPISYEQTPEVHKWKEWLSETHKKFKEKYGGKVFIIFSAKVDGRKEIVNREVVDRIREEIKRLKEAENV
ncbi:MAG: MjaI family restriction endonuclease [Desulfurobacterium sp.]|nr:MAG: MjaI family restriction endonuclease [Desulfurobacterium sp.]